RHPGARTMAPLLLLLLATAHGLVPIDYTPELASSDLGGQITASTFVLEQPRCVFQEFPTEDIWLVVAVPEAVNNFNNSLGPGTPERAFQEFPNSAPAYMTLNTTFFNYPCRKPPGEITVLRVGSESSCARDPSRPTCNGPLPGPGPYRLQGILRVGKLRQGTVVGPAGVGWHRAAAHWVCRLCLPPASTQDGHSDGMIALTTILSILFAILLAGLLAMLVFWGSDSCGCSSSFSKPEAVSVRRYNTHHVYDQPAARL
ncbi:UPK3L protein, partial [Indicator maculatus]|nr:UPK3L protein [Indicator maculatus]